MQITRRRLFRNLAFGAAAAKLVPSLLAEPKLSGSGPLRLDKNESAYGPSPQAIAAMAETALNTGRYDADTEVIRLRQKIAVMHRVSGEQVVLGNGSTSILRMALEAFAGRGRKIILAEPTFDGMTNLARQTGTEVVGVPLTKRHEHDLDAMRARVDGATGLVYICNPNNPTGTLTPRRAMEAFIRSLPPTVAVLIDEAYHHYVGSSADYASFIDHSLEDSRVIVTRTFSKIYGFTTARAGYAIASAKTARLLAAHSLPHEVSPIAAAGALAALASDTHIRNTAIRNINDRQEFLNQANARMVRAIDSQTNFVMINAGDAVRAVIQTFKDNNVILPDPFPGYEQHIRVSLGTESDMNEFWRVWDLMPMHHTMTMSGK
jgi:histidinol-phosphate aminotransferase